MDGNISTFLKFWATLIHTFNGSDRGGNFYLLENIHVHWPRIYITRASQPEASQPRTPGLLREASHLGTINSVTGRTAVYSAIDFFSFSLYHVCALPLRALLSILLLGRVDFFRHDFTLGGP